jgi:hypothetical protein
MDDDYEHSLKRRFNIFHLYGEIKIINPRSWDSSVGTATG